MLEADGAFRDAIRPGIYDDEATRANMAGLVLRCADGQENAPPPHWGWP